MILTKKQTLALDILEDGTTTELLFGGAAGGAKSVLGCYWQIKRRLKMPGTRGLIGRSKLKTLKETTLQSFLWVARQQGLVRGDHFELTGASHIERPNCVDFYNGSLIFLKDLFAYPSDPEFDELGSFEITDAFIDESSQISVKAKDIVNGRIRYELESWCHRCYYPTAESAITRRDESGKAVEWQCRGCGGATEGLIPKTLYTCNPAKNWVYKDFYKPHRDGHLAQHRKYIQSLVTDNPHLPKAYIEQLRRMESKASKERLLKGNWEYDDDPAALMGFDSINDLFSNEGVREKQEDGKPAQPKNKYLIADAARYGSDKFVVMYWEDWVMLEMVVLPKSSVTTMAKVIRELATKHNVPMSKTLVDEDGVGGGVVDILGCKGFVNGSKPVKEKGKDQNYENLKTQCAYKLAEKVNAGGMWLKGVDATDQELIIEELEQIKQRDIDKDGKQRIVAKDSIKDVLGRSPDYADTLIMRMFFDVANYGVYAVR